MAATVSIDEMRDQLVDLDTVREVLASTEPFSQIPIPKEEDGQRPAVFTLHPNWAEGLDHKEGIEPVDATVALGDDEYRLTKDALLEASSAIGITQAYISRTPSELIVPHLNYWYEHNQKDLKLFVQDSLGVAFTRQGIVPFSNLRLLDELLAGIEAAYGEGEVLVDYKFHHDLRRTAVRLIVPDQRRTIRPDDAWSAGIQFQNSLTGHAQTPTSVSGYLFRWVCTNGAINTFGDSGKWNRRTQGQEDANVYEWARASVDDILGGMEHEFEAIEDLANSPLERDLNEVLADVFETYDVPKGLRSDIIEEAVNTGDLTMYGVQQAVTRAANRVGIEDLHRERLMRIGGDLPHRVGSRCESCNRLQL